MRTWSSNESKVRYVDMVNHSNVGRTSIAIEDCDVSTCSFSWTYDRGGGERSFRVALSNFSRERGKICVHFLSSEPSPEAKAQNLRRRLIHFLPYSFPTIIFTFFILISISIPISIFLFSKSFLPSSSYLACFSRLAPSQPNDSSLSLP